MNCVIIILNSFQASGVLLIKNKYFIMPFKIAQIQARSQNYRWRDNTVNAHVQSIIIVGDLVWFWHPNQAAAMQILSPFTATSR